MKKKPVWKQMTPCYDSVLCCPTCGTPIIVPFEEHCEPKSCKHCGTEFDWSETK